MKGIIIYGNPIGINSRATYCDYINDACFDFKTISIDQIGQSGHYIWKVDEHKKIVSSLEGETSKASKAVCSEDDTYDFETGALIALMKTCGLEKSAKAYAEIFDDTAYGDALIERDKLKRHLCYAKEDINMKIGYLKEKDEEIEQLKEKNNGLYNLARKYVDEIDQKDHEIISLKALKITNESLKKDNESFRKTCEKLKEENSRLKNEMHLLMDKNNELVEKKKNLKKKLNAMYGYKEENEKLKLDCEKLQHGYVDTDNVPSGHWDGDILDIVFLPGRACGKQHKALVEIFKRISKDKVDVAYKEVYNTELPAWKKEVLNQMYGIYKESREKAELPRTLDINGVTYRKAVSLKALHRAFIPWELKVPTKREKMWDDIKTFTWKGASCIEVNKADVIDFLEELEKEIPLVHWPTGNKPTSMKPMFNFKMWHECDKVYFFIDDDYVTYGFDKETSRTNIQYVTYLPPMRWDLFKKGRKIIRVTPDNFGEAMACIRANVNLATAYKGWESVIKNNFNKSHAFIRISTILKGTDRGIIEFMWPEDLVKKQLVDPTVYSSNKIIDWEDAR